MPFNVQPGSLRQITSRHLAVLSEWRDGASFTVADVAALLGCSKDTVKTDVLRSLRKRALVRVVAQTGGGVGRRNRASLYAVTDTGRLVVSARELSRLSAPLLAA